jgi:hypothetical protein
MLKKLKHLVERVREKLSLGRRWKAQTCDDEPEHLVPNVVYLVGERTQWAAVFLCPCGCQKPVWLNLLKGHRPLWVVSVNPKGVPTISPSVDRRVGCRSHFFLRNGRIIWCGRHQLFWFFNP